MKTSYAYTNPIHMAAGCCAIDTKKNETSFLWSGACFLIQINCKMIREAARLITYYVHRIVVVLFQKLVGDEKRIMAPLIQRSMKEKRQFGFVFWSDVRN